VLTPAFLACAARVFWEWPRGCGWLSGASPLDDHGSFFPARLGQQQATPPDEGDEDDVRAESGEDEVARQLGAHHHHDEDREDDGTFDDQGEARRLVGQWSAFADPERVQGHQDDGLDGDASEDVADRDVKLAAGCGAVGDRDLRQVRRHSQQDQATESLTEVQPVGEDVGVVRERSRPPR